MANTPDHHVPVLLEEVLNNLVHATAGTYVDATFGRGGHARAMLARLGPGARLVALDRDPRAVSAAEQLAAEDARVVAGKSRLSELASTLAQLDIDAVDGVLMDLGVSSPQLDAADRGFSFRLDGPLDMRMDPDSGQSAAEWLNTAEEQEIADVLKRYGEERHARRIARRIVGARPLETTSELAELVTAAVPQRGGKGKHPATQTFQAIRMRVNDEMAEIERGLEQAYAVLSPGGRLAVISFHSLEDRLVKQYFRSLTRPPALPRRVPIRHAEVATAARDVAGPLAPTQAELENNPRARSAKLRVIERVAS